MIIDETKIGTILKKTKTPPYKTILDILERAKKDPAPLSLDEVGFLLNIDTPDAVKELFKAARQVKERIYGERLVFFAPLYISDFCINDCLYCNFHKSNAKLKRKRLTLDEVEQQVRFLIDMGHKRLLLEYGEDPKNNGIDYVISIIDRIYSIKTEKGNIRRINVNIAATTVENYRRLKEANIGAYQLFQETYHKPTYDKLHCGPKQDFERQLTAHNRAFEAGLDDLGLGALFGLYDYRFEVLALVMHAQYLDKEFGVGPHTISVPRFRPAPSVTYKPEYEVSDRNFLKLIAILRLAVPYTGMIISTRESHQIRQIAFKIGISQTSAGSVTSVGGYGKNFGEPQFTISDERALIEIIDGALGDSLLPSFCTACYRKERTGSTFMDLAKPGNIHNFCRPNGILTFAEYLEDFAVDGIYKKGYEMIDFYLDKIENATLRQQTQERLQEIKSGRRDIYF